MVGDGLVKDYDSPEFMLILVLNDAAKCKFPLFAEPAESTFCSFRANIAE